MSSNNINFTISERKLYLRSLDVIFVLFGLFLVGTFLDFEYFNFSSSNIITWIGTLVIYLLFFGQVFEMYDLKIASDLYSTFKNVVLMVGFTTLLYVFTPIISPKFPESRIQILYFSLTLFIAIFLNRIIYISLIYSPLFLKNILLITEPEYINKIIPLLKDKQSYRIVNYISKTTFKENRGIDILNIDEINFEEIIDKEYINEIIVSSNASDFIPDEVNSKLIELFEKGIIIKSADNFIEELTFSISEQQLNSKFYNYFTFSKNHNNNLYIAFRRILDILFSIFGILLFAILIPIVFIGNLFGNRGELLYFQKRVGRKGKEFTIIKFRSMVSNAEENGAVWAHKKDDRITSFGRILRKTRLDEFPQFLNVLKGDMSLIGPRPERPEFVKQLEKELPFYAIRHVIKPGLTGWAQVMHPYAGTIDDQHKKLMLDLYYIKERSSLLDFKIVIKTISTVLFFRGT
ncbi:exopolysaccharide biosynthesis polyprenyl glycosylphosphotransferase [Lutibacter sp. B1]|uniref:exopolysaccharide biosynthesis polyprenyl glycosylphosphotransferase n=1 Tax=Lutibacter sp. B1 TaxID=2725996 RepID=UPI001457376D|nr:exopolysaccharide biosynthesis polyprenyl glycosylphosphotransferase [Lutibacter sp. B1]NLP58144.1 exopolysaccharide biosynthesis polyprenyl glycosylphosphotransferase [Lutibacter sp. B1]